jgi:hypothetical protein
LFAEALPFQVVDTWPEIEIVQVTPDTEVIVLECDNSCLVRECDRGDTEEAPEETSSEHCNPLDTDNSNSELLLGVAIPVGEDFAIENEGLVLTLKHMDDGTILLSLVSVTNSDNEI